MPAADSIPSPAAHEPFHHVNNSKAEHPPTSYHRRRPLFWLALAFCAGISADNFFALNLPTLGGLSLSAFLATLALLFSKRHPAVPAPAPARRHTHMLCGIFLALASGMLIHALRARIPAPDDISRCTSALPSFVHLRGTVIDAPSPQHESSDKTLRPATQWTLAIEALGSDENNLSPASGRIRVSYHPSAFPDAAASATLPQKISEGDRLEFRARLEAPPELTLPDTFDSAAWLESQGIRRVGTLFSQTLRVLPDSAWWRVDFFLRAASSTLAQRVEDLLPQTEAGRGKAALLNALLFGRREHVDRSDRESFAASGTAHLLAISGLQIQFLAILLFKAAAWLGLSRRRSAWAVLLLSIGYCALAGADAPIVRATVMIALYLLATLCYREADPLSVLGASALAILFVAPAELFNAGFQLSFLAVLALATIFPALEAAFANRPQHPSSMIADNSLRARWLAWFGDGTRQSLFVTLAAWIATAPVVAWHMGRFATLSLAVNLIAVPLSTFCMIVGMLMLGLSVISSVLAQLVAYVASGSLFILQWFIDLVAALPGASIDLPAPAWPLLVVYAGVLVWIWRERGREATLPRIALLFCACLLALNAGLFFREPLAAASVTVLDLNHGRAALVESPTGNAAALIDAGGLGDGQRIAELLRRRGISRLALLVITTDEPEAIDGAAEVLQHIPAARVMLPRAASASAARRELERSLSTAQIPYGPPDLTQALQSPGGMRWDFCDDGAPPDHRPGSQSALCVRVSVSNAIGRDSVLFLAARSNASLQRLRQNARLREASLHDDMLQSGVIRASAGLGGSWPSEFSELLSQSGCRTLIAGSRSDPEESSGLNLAALSQSRGMRILWPHREGSLRIQADVGVSTAQTLQSFRNGVWQAVP